MQPIISKTRGGIPKGELRHEPVRILSSAARSSRTRFSSSATTKASVEFRERFKPARCRLMPTAPAITTQSLRPISQTDRRLLTPEPMRCLGRVIPGGTILDPATTRAVTAGICRSVSPALLATNTGFVRDPFSFNPACRLPASSVRRAVRRIPRISTGQIRNCFLNQIDPARLDQNAISLLNLFPSPTTHGIANNFASSRPLYEHRNSFDTRLDVNFTPERSDVLPLQLRRRPAVHPGNLRRHRRRRRLPAGHSDRARAAERSGVYAPVFVVHRQRGARRIELSAHHAYRPRRRDSVPTSLRSSASRASRRAS